MAIPSPFEFIPSQLHLASLFLVGIAGFFVIISFSSAKMITVEKTVKIKTDPDESEAASIVSEAPVDISSPSKRSTIPEYGSVETPGGRRSARVRVRVANSAQKTR
eukprot:scaffold1377_cov231-Chaetoceros_neogracile.AAC.9